MKKLIFTTFILSILGLLFNVVHAEEITPPSNQTVVTENNNNPAEPGIKPVEISKRDFYSHVPFVFQHDYNACMNKCSQDHTSCVSKTGDNPTAINNCDEQRWRCTLSCDDKYYGSNTF